MRIRRLDPLFLLLLAAVPLACGDGDAGSPPVAKPNLGPAQPEPVGEEAVAPDPLRVTIGPAGGTIEGKAESVFEGVKLVIPPGALAADTEVTIAPIDDPTPLPRGARRVGPQFLIGPENATLALSASLTLPAIEAEVESFGATTEEAKVWKRDADKWTLVTPTSTAPGLVTIDIDALGTVAAGVKDFSLPPACQGAALLECIKVADCKNGNGFCVRSFGALAPVPDDNARYAFGLGLHYLTTTSNGLAAVRRIITNEGFMAMYPPQVTPAAPGLTYVRMNAAVRGSDGSYWFGNGYGGNVRYRFPGNAAAPVTEQPTVYSSVFYGRGLGAIQTGESFAFIHQYQVYRLDPQSNNGTYNPPLMNGVSATSHPIFLPVRSPTYPLIDTAMALYLSQSGTYEIDSFNVWNPTFPRENAAQHFTLPRPAHALKFTTASDGTIAVIHSATRSVAIYHGNVLAKEVVLPGGLEPRDLTYDGADNLWVVPYGSPEVVRISSTDTKVYSLTDAAEGSDEYYDKTPMQVLNGFNTPGFVFVINNAKELVSVSYGVKRP